MRATPALPDPRPLPPGACIGIDLVRVERIARSMADFGERFARRLFAPGELRAATVAGRLDAGELAMRFAAKEAAIKAFDLGEAGVGWSQIEVTDVRADGRGRLGRVRLHGRAAASAARAAGAPHEIAVALAHDDALACAILVALPRAPHVLTNPREESTE
jgi:holo-[acyl-carrier protein] synthase